MNILFIGDIVGKIGRKALLKSLTFVKEKYKVDFTIANGENITHGRGINKVHLDFLLNLGVNCVTLGNHYKDKIQVVDILDNDALIRPLNLKYEFPGTGSNVYLCKGKKIRVSNILGTAFMKEEVNDPYITMNKILDEDKSDVNIIDFHAEATGEKKALAFAFENKITCLVGTHTHVQTADNQILDTGVAYISDVGMCGAFNSVLGDEKRSVINRIILHDEKARFKILEDDDLLFNAVVIKIDDKTNKAKEILRINLKNGKEI
ncbi:MAG: TIGR00282 family metallophosphoesterase [Bacilli bacterium]